MQPNLPFLAALLAVGALASNAPAAITLQFDDVANPAYATGLQGIDLTALGYGTYDVFFVSGRQETTDGWNAVLAAYGGVMSADIYPNAANSELLSQLIKREIRCPSPAVCLCGRRLQHSVPSGSWRGIGLVFLALQRDAP